jgi:hypothetical protein
MSFATLSLEPFLNSVGSTYDTQRVAGLLNAWGNSFPAEELPFGSTLTVGGIPFQLPDKVRTHDDVVEPLGQTIRFPDDRAVTALALLCCGEMGEQSLQARAVRASGGAPIELIIVAKGFSVAPTDDLGPDAHRFTHLHYPGDYDLGIMTGALWCFRHQLEEPVRLTRLELGTNPLFRIAALTLIYPD